MDEQKERTTQPLGTTRPIVVLCGSTRFYETFQRENLRLTVAGSIVLSIGAAKEPDGATFAHLDPGEYARVKADLDRLHFDKLALANRVGGPGSHALILNVGGYIGESTRNEMDYASSIGLPMRFLEA